MPFFPSPLGLNVMVDVPSSFGSAGNVVRSWTFRSFGMSSLLSVPWRVTEKSPSGS